MKKFLFTLLLVPTIIITGCTDSDGIKINPENRESNEGSSVDQVFNKQINETQYIKDLEDFLSYNTLLITEKKPYISTFSFDVDFDKKSSVQGGLEFSKKNIKKSEDYESMDIEFNLEAMQNSDDSEPIDSLGNITLLYQDDEMYANVHNFVLSMGEGNMTAKMYTLLLDMIKDKWVNLEVNNGGIISVNKDESTKLTHIIGSLKNVLETKEIESDSNFSNGLAEIVDVINSYIDLGISTNELKLISHEIEYSELSKNLIQKTFTGSFQGKDTAFDMSFLASSRGLDFHIYNIKEYDTDTQNYMDKESELIFSLKEKGKSDYSITLQLLKSQQKIADLEGKIKYGNETEFSAKFILEPIELIAGQKISGKIDGNIAKKPRESGIEMPELTGDILLLSELLSSL